MGKSSTKAFMLPRSIVLTTFLYCLISSASGQIFFFETYDDSESTETSAEYAYHVTSDKVIATQGIPIGKYSLLDPLDEKFEANDERFNELEGPKPQEKSPTFETRKGTKFAKEPKKINTEQPLINSRASGASSVKSIPKGRQFFLRRRNRSIQHRRNRRDDSEAGEEPAAPPAESAPAPKPASGSASPSASLPPVAPLPEVGEGEEGGDPPARDHPKPTPSPHVMHSGQFALTKTETGQSQSQQSGADDKDEMQFNPDGSVSAHKLGTSNLNKQESVQFSKSESQIPVAHALDVAGILGKDETGAQKSLLGHNALTGLQPLPQMVPIQAARPKARRRSKNRSVNGEVDDDEA